MNIPTSAPVSLQPQQSANPAVDQANLAVPPTPVVTNDLSSAVTTNAPTNVSGAVADVSTTDLSTVNIQIIGDDGTAKPLTTAEAAALTTDSQTPVPASQVNSVSAVNSASQVSPASQASETTPPPDQNVTADPASQLTPDLTTNTSPSKIFTSSSPLANILMREQKLTPEQVGQLEVAHIQSGRAIEVLIEEQKLVDELSLSKAKAEVYGVPFVRISEIGISPEALNTLSETVARRYSILPFAIDSKERKLSVVMLNPLDLGAIDFAQQKSGFRLVIHFAMPSELERTIAERYAQSLSTEVTQALQETAQVAEAKQQSQQIVSGSTEIVRQAPITKIVETILSFAVKARASDIHIEPQEDRTRVRYRIDGILTEKLILPASVHEATISRIKILSDLKIDEKRVPQDGRFNFNMGGDDVDLRVSTLPTIHGEKVVMRLLRKNAQVPPLEDLGLRGLALRQMEDAIKVPHGIILVTGPTGSGKTTTLYSVLHMVNTPKVNIMTLEDPVEYQMPGINQVQINPQAGLSFASGLRSFLRQDPNIIMVGEIRDSETAELAIQASLTGHLVFSTLHTSSAAGALPRLLDMGAEPFLLASSMTLTMAQRVLRIINPNYKEEYTPEAAVVADIKAVLGNQYLLWCKENNKDPENMVLYRPKADRPQVEPEFKGRVAIFEVMRITDEISKLIMERKSANALEEVAKKDGMLVMKQDGYLKALDGMTTIEEVLRVAQV